MNWSHASVVILTCERDREMVELARRGIELFWPGANVCLLWDTDTATETELPGDVRDVVREVPYLRKVFDLPYIAPTDQLYCLDSDCFTCAEPVDWAPAAHNAVGPGSMGKVWLQQASEVWQSLGRPALPQDHLFCGGCWSASREEMFGGDRRELAIEYVRECVRRGYHKTQYPGPVCEQGLLNGLWHTRYVDTHLIYERYPLYVPKPNMTIYHLSDTARSERGPEMLARYRRLLALKEQSCESV